MITFSYARRYKTLRPEINRVQQLGHRIEYLDVLNRVSRIVAKGECANCGGLFVIERNTGSTEADALTITGDVLAMECV